MFVFLFGVTAPALAMTNDYELAWKIAVAAAFLSGLVEALVAFLAIGSESTRRVRRY